MSFFDDLKGIAKKIDEGIEKIPEGLQHAHRGVEISPDPQKNQVIGIWNPNRRHDDPEEIRHDQIRAQINASHRFHSFAAERGPSNFVKWHIDGHDYMYAVSELLDKAQEVIFILDWWLTPELFLRRPPSENEQWRLDRLLKRKAEQGVKIHIVVYKEVTQTMSMSSWNTKHALEDLVKGTPYQDNIVVLRHPDHIGAKDTVEFWSHHEKLVVVDNHYACVGGLDLCFGRWDTHTHPLADVHPTRFARTLFPGQDYNNARVADFQNVREYGSNAAISILETPRMPWHDVHMTLTGPVVLDLVQHFVERWNEIKKRKYRNEQRVEWLALPHNIEAPNEAVVRHPHRERWHEIGRRYKQRWFGSNDDNRGHPRPDPAPCRVQAIRSVSDWSHGVLTEHSIQNAYIQLISEAEKFIYIENQFFISATKGGEQIVNMIGKALVERVARAAREGTKFKVIIVIPELPGFSGNIKDESSLKFIMAAQYRTMNRGGSSIFEQIRKAGIEPMDYIRFYHLRTYDRLNAPVDSLIKQMEQNSGVRFYEAQVALAKQYIGADPNQKDVKLRVPKSEASGPALDAKEDKKDVDVLTIPLPETEEEAREVVSRFEHGSDAIRDDENVSDAVGQHAMLDSTALQDELWVAPPEEELKNFVSELVYIHGKVMIVDDRRVIMGSANLNDRSQKGDGDSEIALVVEDTDMIQSTMNGEPYMVARFATSLRRKLWREHLGLIDPQDCDLGDASRPTSFMHAAPRPNEEDFGSREDREVADPICEHTLRLWNDTARRNREIFTELFLPVPTNLVRNWKAYDNYLPKVKTGHVVSGIGLDRVKSRLAEVRGHLVECPMDFLIDEPDFVEGPAWHGLNPTLPIYL
ncbi:phospholipase D/nuclease [Fistulina hepatica ATCC 64428]|uniref:Phospholipase n=1 Tax=Fistulina hepatica ATCC 64428 TaxID=1128425 RepID=A0A0D7AD33_9AGAR|nr:phospholipase D/nuclease [Fistulina hepatica ATCC 64428]